VGRFGEYRQGPPRGDYGRPQGDRDGGYRPNERMRRSYTPPQSMKGGELDNGNRPPQRRFNEEGDPRRDFRDYRQLPPPQNRPPPNNGGYEKPPHREVFYKPPYENGPRNYGDNQQNRGPAPRRDFDNTRPPFQ
jgi:hypothetical protein